MLLAAVEAGRDSLAPGDVARGVLVEERVEEDDPGLADARVAVDERDLAEEARPLVGRHLLAHGVGAGLRAHLDDLAPLEAQLEAAHDRAAEGERERRAHVALGAARGRAS